MGTIDNFVRYIEANPPQRTNQFRMSITRNSQRAFYCESVTVPGRSLATMERRQFGTQREFPYERLYSGDLEISLIISETGGERKYFEDWMNEIIDDDHKIADSRQAWLGSAEIELHSPWDRNAPTPFSKLKFVEVFPKAIGTINLSMTADDEYAVLPISLSFRSYTYEGEDGQAFGL